MFDPQVQDFEERLRRIDKVHRRGGGFEAHGTVGRPVPARRAPRRGYLRAIIMIATGVTLLKAALLMQVGAADYQGRVERLQQGSQIEAAGAWVLQMDPATVWLSERMREVFKPVN